MNDETSKKIMLRIADDYVESGDTRHGRDEVLGRGRPRLLAFGGNVKTARALVVPMLRNAIADLCEKSEASPVEVLQALSELICLGCIKGSADQNGALEEGCSCMTRKWRALNFYPCR
jgi:hypothetical protein